MEIINGMEITGLGLFIKAHKALIISDVHIGLEEALNKQGVLVPRFQLKKVIESLDKMIEERKPSMVVINGDLKHEFGAVSEQEWRDTLKVIDFIERRCPRIVLVKGNHDTILEPIAGKRDIKIVDHLALGDIYICHGDKMPTDNDYPKAKIVVIGHEHPAVSIREGSRSETFKCFLAGKIPGKEIIVLPSMNFVTEGTDVLKENLMSPFLKNINNFEIYVVADEIYHFGKVKDLLDRL
jgi:uncharacterized protein